MSSPSEIEIDVQSTFELLQSNNDEGFLLLDCREPKEYKTCQIQRSMLIPMAEVPTRIGELQAWKDKPIVVHCHHGGRSLRVTEYLRENGFPQAQNMTGGIDAWSLQIDPEVPRY